MKKPLFTSLATIAAMLWTACSHREVPAVYLADFSGVAASAVLRPDDVPLDSVVSYSGRHMTAFNSMAAVMNLDSFSRESVRAWLAMPAVRLFSAPTDSVFPSSRPIARQIAGIFTNAGSNGLNLDVDSFATVIWGRPQSIMTAGGTMLIALNHYLGANHPAYNTLPEYRRKDKRPSRLPYDIAEAAVALAYPFSETDSSKVISRLCYEGALTEAKMRLVPGAELHLALGYTPGQLQWLDDHEAELWRKMVGSRVIFDSSVAAEKLVNPAPFTSMLSPDTPGRAGRYIGYKIVRAYLAAHPGTALSTMLSPAFYNRENPLVDARYCP